MLAPMDARMPNGPAHSTLPGRIDRLLPYITCLIACMAVNLFYFPAATVFPDEVRILGSATRLAASGEFWVGSDRAWEMPGAALFFTPAVWLFGPGAAIYPLRFAQALLVVLQCGLIGAIAFRLTKQPRVALIARWLAALYPFLIFYQGLLLSETLFNTFLLAGFAAMFWWRDRGLRIDVAFVLTCLAFAAATMTKATLTVLPPFLLAATAFVVTFDWRPALRTLIAASCLYAAFMSPWWVRNAIMLHDFVPFTTSSGMNLYLGNNPRNTSAGIAWDKDAEPEVVARIATLPTELERQRAYSKAATDYIRAEPERFAAMAVRKLLRLWNIVPNADEFRTGLYAVVSALSFGPILLLALLGAVWLRHRWRDLLPIYLTIGYFTFVHTVTIASLRYRFPVDLLLIVLAAPPLSCLIERLRSRLLPHQAKIVATEPKR